MSLEFLVIDEADLIFSFGYENDLKKILNYFPKDGCQVGWLKFVIMKLICCKYHYYINYFQLTCFFQTVLTSATVNCGDDGLKAIKDLCVKNPVILKLEESSLPDSSQLTQYQIK